MQVFRLALPDYSANALMAFSGSGAQHASGRWHNKGPHQAIVYTSSSIALAAMELLGHLGRSDDVLSFNLYVAELPDACIADVGALPPGWKDDYSISRGKGDSWLKAKSSVALRVPAVHADFRFTAEANYLINPAHPDFQLSWVTHGPLRYDYDRRLTRK